MWKGVCKNYRRLVAFLLITVMVCTNAGGKLGTVFAAGENVNALFLLDSGELHEAIQEAKEQGEKFDFTSLELAASKKSIKNQYEKILGTKKGTVYQLDVDVDTSYAPGGTAVQVFYHAGTEEVIFLFLNESGLVVDYRVNISGYETEPVTVKPNTANMETEDESTLSRGEDHNAANMIDDVKKESSAEVVNPTVEEETNFETTEETEESILLESDAAINETEVVKENAQEEELPTTEIEIPDSSEAEIPDNSAVVEEIGQEPVEKETAESGEL